jgi:hypothetical protein
MSQGDGRLVWPVRLLAGSCWSLPRCSHCSHCMHRVRCSAMQGGWPGGNAAIAPGKAWERRKDVETPETFRRNPVGKQSHPAKPGQQPEARLACRVGRPTPRGVDSQQSGPAIEPRNLAFRRGQPSPFAWRGAVSARCNGLACRSRRGRRPEHSCIRVPREPGRSVLLR